MIDTGVAKLNYEEPQTTTSGERIWLRTSKIPLRDANQRIIGVLGVYEDITARKQMEEALRASEALFRSLVDSAPLGIAISSSRDEQVEYLNRRFIELFGYTRENIPSVDHWWPLAYPDEQYRESVVKLWFEKVEEAREGVPVSPMEAMVRCKDGTTRYIQFHLSSIGERNYTFFNDLTERKIGEEERERLLAEMDAMFSAFADGVILYSPSIEIMRLNKSAEKISRYPFAMLPKNAEERVLLFGLTKPDGTPLRSEEGPVARAILENVTTRNVLLYRQRSDGRMTTGSIAARPPLSPAGWHSAGRGADDSTISRRYHDLQQRQARLSPYRLA